MSNYITLLVVDNPTYGPTLVKAPAFSPLKRGDKVILRGKEKPLDVLAALTCELSSDEYQFCMDAFSASDSRMQAVRAKLEYREFTFGEDEQQ